MVPSRLPEWFQRKSLRLFSIPQVRLLDKNSQARQLLCCSQRKLGVTHPIVTNLGSIAHLLGNPRLCLGRRRGKVGEDLRLLQFQSKEGTLAGKVSDIQLDWSAPHVF